MINFVTFRAIYTSHKLVDAFSQNHFFGEFGTDFSDCRRGSELPFFLNKRKDPCLEMCIALFRNSISLSR